jgi:hypothetical protein
MTFETIDLHGFIAMARDTKTVVARDHAVILDTGMAFDTILETDLVIAYAFAHCLVTLILQ